MVSYDFPMMFPLVPRQESTQKGANGDAHVSEDFLARGAVTFYTGIDNNMMGITMVNS